MVDSYHIIKKSSLRFQWGLFFRIGGGQLTKILFVFLFVQSKSSLTSCRMSGEKYTLLLLNPPNRTGK